MRLRTWIVGVFLLGAMASAGLVLARDPNSQSAVTAQQLIAEALAREPDKEVNAQVYTFAPGAVLPWHRAEVGLQRKLAFG